MTEIQILCKSCRFCADGTEGNRKCYHDRLSGVRMTCIPIETRRNCSYYEKSDTPSWQRYDFVECPVCRQRIPRMMIGSGSLRALCDRCGYDSLGK